MITTVVSSRILMLQHSRSCLVYAVARRLLARTAINHSVGGPFVCW